MSQNNNNILEENNADLQFVPQDVCPDVKDQVNQPTPPPSYDVVPVKQEELNSHPQIDPNLSGYGGNATQGAAPQSIEPAGTYSQGHQVHPPTVQCLGGGYGWCTPMGVAPILYQGPQNIMQPGPQFNQAGSYMQGQNNNNTFLEENNVDLQFIPQDVCPDVKDQVNQPTPPPSYNLAPAKQQEFSSHPQIAPNLSGYGGNTTQGAALQSIEPPCILYGTAGTYSQGHQVHPPTVQSLGGGYGWCTPMGAAPILYQGPQNIMQPGPQSNQAGSYMQGQHNIMMTPLQMNLNQSMGPVGVVNGQRVYGLPSYFHTAITSAAPPPLPPPPPLSTSNLKKRKREDKHSDRAYVKKPPNAFMLFMKEERPKYVATMKGIGTAGVNKFLGDKWSLLSKEEKEIYYEQAHREKLLHAQQHPDWSARDNYGLMKKKDRSKPPRTEASAWISDEVTQTAKKKCVSPRYADVTVDPHTLSNLMEPPNSMQLPQTQPPISTNDGGMGHLPPVKSTSMDSPAAVDDNQRVESSHLTRVTHPYMVEMFELLEKVESLPPTTQTQQPISEIQTTELEHFALLNDPLEEWFIDLLKSPPPVSQTQQPISEVVQSQTTESDDFTRLEDSKAMSFMDMPKSHPPVTQTQQPISEIQTTEPDPFAWLDEAMSFSFLDMLEFPLCSSMPQTHFSNSVGSPTALGDYERVESNSLAGAEHL